MLRSVVICLFELPIFRRLYKKLFDSGFNLVILNIIYYVLSDL